MPAIHRPRGWALPTSNRPDTSRHIACLPSRQPLPRRRSLSRHGMSAVGADSATQRETDDAHILKADPLAPIPVGRDGSLGGTRSVGLNGQRVDSVPSHRGHNATIPQHQPRHAEDLLRSDGISKAGWSDVQEVTFAQGNFADARTFPLSAYRCHEIGGCSSMIENRRR